VGTLSLYDRHGERQHTTYIGATPEYGQAHFTARMEDEVALQGSVERFWG
jgi:hypothetical protein